MEGIIDYNNLHEMLKVTFDKYPKETGYRKILNDKGDMTSVSWEEFYGESISVSKALIKSGIKKDDKVAILGYCSYEWVMADMGSVFIGACTVGIYHSLFAPECEYIIKHSDSKIIFVENEELLEKILSIKKKIPKVKNIILMNGRYSGKDNKFVLTIDEFIKKGSAVTEKSFINRTKAVKPHDLASIVYTSGTSGIPKGVMITHDNLIFTAQSINYVMPVFENDETILFLPLAHVFARMDIYATIVGKITLTFARSIETVVEDIKLVRPHWFPGVPRIYEKIYIKIMDGAEKKGGVALFIFNLALKIGYKVSDAKLKKRKVPCILKLLYGIVNKLIFSKIHDVLGGRLRICVSGAAPLNPIVARFFHAAGITIVEGYGMTENTSFTHNARIDDLKFGSVGYIAPSLEHKISDSGEILVRGRNIMKGYYKDVKGTKKVLTRDGWLHTGDVGTIDSKGMLTITGRMKEIIITSGGKNIAPALIENKLLTTRYIAQVLIIGDKQKYLTALVTLNIETITEYATANKISYDNFNELNSDPSIKKIIDNEISKVNLTLPPFETIKNYTIVPEFSIDDGLLTPTFKPRRNEILSFYKKEIETFYE